jgi:SAM-dependent methyltransferase
LDVARRLLTNNGIGRDRIHTAEIGDDGRIPFDCPIDLVLSLLSWGYHYPISVYLDQVSDLLTPGGTLVVDVRKPSDGEELLHERFPSLTVIYETEKYRRVVGRKP